MNTILFASYGYAWASGAAFLIALFAAFMSTGKSENELWRRFSILSTVNTVFCLAGAAQNRVTPELYFDFNRLNMTGGILLAPAFLDFVMCFLGIRARLPGIIAWLAALGWSAVFIFAPGWIFSNQTNFIEMPLHYFVLRPAYLAFVSTTFGIIVCALFLLYARGRKMAEREGLLRLVFPTCFLWALCGFWDTTLSELLRIPLPLSWLGGLSVNVAFLVFVTTRSQEAFRVQEKHKSVMKDVGQARQIQLGLIPNEFPVVDEVKIVGKYLPMQELGGDFYEVRMLDPDRIALFISDVTGHGITSAFITAMMKISLDSLPPGILRSPVQVLDHLNRTLTGKIMDRFITGIYGILNKRTLEFEYCSAGHHPPILVRSKDGNVLEIETRGRLMGAFDELLLKTQTVQLFPGDRMLLVTDGLYEAINRKAEMFGLERLKEVFRDEQSGTLDPLFLAINMFARGMRQADDMAGLLVVCTDTPAQQSSMSA